MDIWNILFHLDLIIFVLVLLTVGYMAVFAVASLFNRHSQIPKAKKENRFVILIPAYKNGAETLMTVRSILGQSYPQRQFDVTVISNSLDEMSNFRLAQQPITLLTPHFKKSSRSKALQVAINNLPQFKIYDIVIILDPGSTVEPEFLQQMNDAFEAAGTKALQAHRVSRNHDTAPARLSAIFEEINNSIFRRGHVTLGLSAASAGAAMAFEFSWFKRNIMATRTRWDDKELEILLLRQHVYIDYFDNILVFEEKGRRAEDFNRQHFRWLRSQFMASIRNMHYLPGAILARRYDLIDKLVQWMLIPRVPMMVIICLAAVILPFVYFTLAIKWWIMFAVVLFIFALATPNYLVDEKWNRTFFLTPVIFLSSVLSRTVIGDRLKHYVNRKL